MARAMREAQRSYQVAIALQASGQDSAGEWGRFAQSMAVALGGNAAASEWAWMNRIGYPREDEAGVRAGVRSVLRTVAEWDGGPAALGRWNDAATQIASHERSAALAEMEVKSPEFARMRAGYLPGAETPFRAAGVTAGQRRGLADLLARSMLNRPGVSAVGKEIDGLGLGDFVTTAQAELGVRLTDARLETVMRTSIATAQTEAENGIMDRPTVRLMAPLLQWSNPKDGRSRATHAAMSGYVNTVEAYRILRLGPPGGFSCRCFRIPVSLARCYSLGLTDANGTPDNGAIRDRNGARNRLIESGLFPDPGFAGPS